MMEDISKMAMTAVLVEGIITYLNEFFVAGAVPWQMVASLALGVIVAVAYNFDLPKYLNMVSTIPYIGCILTGIIISRGSNYVYDLLTKLTSM